MKKTESSGEHRSKAYRFTLIELLVVIAIIAILAAILLPSLQQARQRGIAANCVSNQKQLGSIIMQYMNDYDGYWPRPKEAVSYWWYGLRFYLPAYKLTTSGTPSVNVSDRVLRKRTAPLFYCPAVFQNPYLSSQYREVYYVSPRWIRFGMASSWYSPKNDRASPSTTQPCVRTFLKGASVLPEPIAVRRDAWNQPRYWSAPSRYTSAGHSTSAQSSITEK